MKVLCQKLFSEGLIEAMIDTRRTVKFLAKEMNYKIDTMLIVNEDLENEDLARLYLLGDEDDIDEFIVKVKELLIH